jgi:hypothetical protein
MWIILWSMLFINYTTREYRNSLSHFYLSNRSFMFLFKFLLPQNLLKKSWCIQATLE